MFIPAGCTVLANVWAILHDPKLFPDPEVFDPAHFISTEKNGLYPSDACVNGESPYPDAAFGYGRRICPGRLLAKDNVWLAIASVLSMFNIAPAKDENGRDVPVTDSCLSAMLTIPDPFKFVIKPRSQKALETVMATAVEDQTV